MALTVVTAIYGPGFRLHEPVKPWKGVRFVCVTDQPIESRHWNVLRRPLSHSPRRANRMVKSLIHEFVTGTTMYLDAEFQLTSDPRYIVRPALSEADWAATRHPRRDCLFDEADFCQRKKRIESIGTLKQQVEHYRTEGMPRHFGLWAGGIIVRRDTEATRKLNAAWWVEIERWSERDQIALPFVVRKLNMPPATIFGVYTSLAGVARRKLARSYAKKS